MLSSSLGELQMSCTLHVGHMKVACGWGLALAQSDCRVRAEAMQASWVCSMSNIRFCAGVTCLSYEWS